MFNYLICNPLREGGQPGLGRGLRICLMKEHPVGDLSSRSRFRDQRSKSSKVAAATIQLIFQLKSSSFWVTLSDIGQCRGSSWRDEHPRVAGRGRGRRKATWATLKRKSERSLKSLNWFLVGLLPLLIYRFATLWRKRTLDEALACGESRSHSIRSSWSRRWWWGWWW